MIFNNVVDVQLLSNASLFATPWLQHVRHPCPSLSPGVCSNSCPLRWWCYPTISSPAAPFSFCLQSFPASESFPMSQFFCIRWPKSFSISPSSEYWGLMSFSIDWFAVKGLSRVFSSTTIWEHQFFGAQPCNTYAYIQGLKKKKVFRCSVAGRLETQFFQEVINLL